MVRATTFNFVEQVWHGTCPMPPPPLKSLKNEGDRAASNTCTLYLLSLSPPSPTTRYLSSLTSLSLSSPSLHPFSFLAGRGP